MNKQNKNGHNATRNQSFDKSQNTPDSPFPDPLFPNSLCPTSLCPTSLWLIGIGDNGLESLGLKARRLVEEADIIMGGPRHLAFVASLSCKTIAWPGSWSPASRKALVNQIKNILEQGKNLVILATGDPLWYGIGSLISQSLSPEQWQCLPQASAFQLAASCLGWPLQDCRTLSLHGRSTQEIIPHLCKGGFLLMLAQGTTATQLRQLLDLKGFSSVNIRVLEHLGSEKERLYVYDPIKHKTTAELATLAVDLGNPRLTAPLSGLPDEDFVHDGLLTKREIRAITLAKLAPAPHETLWDLGAGNGSIAIEWCRLCAKADAIAVENRPERIEKIYLNAQKLAAFNLGVYELDLHTCLDSLYQSHPPQAIFIGGGLNEKILKQSWDYLPEGGRLVANAVTLASEALLAAFPAKVGRSQTGHLARISVEYPREIGEKVGWKSLMTLTQLAIEK